MKYDDTLFGAFIAFIVLLMCTFSATMGYGIATTSMAQASKEKFIIYCTAKGESIDVCRTYWNGGEK